MEKKPQSLQELAAIAEQYLTAHNKKLSSRDFNAKKSIGAQRPEGKIPDIAPTTTVSIKCFSCGKVGRRASSASQKFKRETAKDTASDVVELVILSCIAKKKVD